MAHGPDPWLQLQAAPREGHIGAMARGLTLGNRSETDRLRLEARVTTVWDLHVRGRLLYNANESGWGTVGDVSVMGSLAVDGGLTVAQGLGAGTLALSGDARVAGSLTAEGNTTLAGPVVVGAGLSAAGPGHFRDRLRVEGPAWFAQGLTAEGPVRAARELEVAGAARIADLVVGGNLSGAGQRLWIADDATVRGGLAVERDVAVAGGVEVAQGLAVERDVAVAGGVEVAQGLAVRGPARVHGALGVGGAARVADLAVGGNLSGAGQRLWIADDATVQGGLAVERDVAVAGGVEVAQGLAVRGPARVHGALEVGGAARVADLAVGGNLSGAGQRLWIADDAAVGGGLAVGRDVAVKGGVTVAGAGQVVGNLTVEGDVWLHGRAVQVTHGDLRSGPGRDLSLDTAAGGRGAAVVIGAAARNLSLLPDGGACALSAPLTLNAGALTAPRPEPFAIGRGHVPGNGTSTGLTGQGGAEEGGAVLVRGGEGGVRGGDLVLDGGPGPAGAEGAVRVGGASSRVALGHAAAEVRVLSPTLEVGDAAAARPAELRHVPSAVNATQPLAIVGQAAGRGSSHIRGGGVRVEGGPGLSAGSAGGHVEIDGGAGAVERGSVRIGRRAPAVDIGGEGEVRLRGVCPALRPPSRRTNAIDARPRPWGLWDSAHGHCHPLNPPQPPTGGRPPPLF